MQGHQLTRPSFVNSVSLSTVMDHGVDDRTGSKGSSQPGKGSIRIDSVAFKPGSVNSSQRLATDSDAV
jgi:hypothetical protein